MSPQIHAEEEAGGVLVFLPGQDDIESLQLLLEEHLPSVSHRRATDGAAAEGTEAERSAASMQDFEVRPLYAAMPPEEQLKVFAPAPPAVRKFVLSTNIAETSVTISGIKYGESEF